MKRQFTSYISRQTEAAPLAAFRILFGCMMFVSIIRFWSLGWIQKLYLDPKLFFSYYGFEFVKPLGQFTYLIFVICGLASLGVALGYKYRISIITFFISFTYIELMDKTTYLNHYYFISLMSFLMIFLPANAYFSLDAARNSSKRFQYVPRWSIDSVKLLLGLVYFFAGLAKLNSEWIVHAMPLKIWLPSKFDLPLLGDLLQEPWAIYAFSWCGALFDLSVPFLLANRKTRIYAFVLVVIFHALTRILFPIGMFPYIMIVSTTIFFDASIHKKALSKLASLFRFSADQFNNGLEKVQNWSVTSRLKVGLIAAFFIVQVIFPFRYLMYPGELFWTEQGFRFSWRVMLMEKAGIATFKIVDKESSRSFVVDNADYLTKFQEKQMATQPDFILQYARYLEKDFEEQGLENIEIYVESYVALNGRRSRPYLDPGVNLLELEDSFAHKNWILPFDETITGF